MRESGLATFSSHEYWCPMSCDLTEWNWNEMWQGKSFHWTILKSVGANKERLALALAETEVNPPRKEKMLMTLIMVLSNQSFSMATRPDFTLALLRLNLMWEAEYSFVFHVSTANYHVDLWRLNLEAMACWILWSRGFWWCMWHVSCP